MKRCNGIFEKICTIENLREAHKNARKDKLFYREVKMVDSNVDYYLKTCFGDDYMTLPSKTSRDNHKISEIRFL